MIPRRRARCHASYPLVSRGGKLRARSGVRSTSSACGLGIVRRTDNGGAQRTLTGFPDYLHALAVTADGTLLAAAGEDGAVRIYVGTAAQPTKVIPVPQ